MKIIVLFNDNITRNRAAHVIKIARIISNITKNVDILISRCDYEACKDVIEATSKLGIRIYIMDHKTSNIKTSLIREWLISVVQYFRYIQYFGPPDVLIVMGTLNLPLVVMSRLLPTIVLTYAGGFAYHNLRNSLYLINKIKSYINYLIEFFILIFTSYLLLESESMKKLIPLRRISNIVFRNKIITGLHLCVDDVFFNRRSLGSRAYDIGYIGALEPHRGIVELTKVLTHILKINRQVKAILIGDGSLYQYVDRSLKTYIDAGNVILLKYIPHVTLPQYTQNIKIFLFLTHSDGLPNIILEAMASGCVVVSTPVGGIPDVIINGKTGFLLHSSKPSEVLKLVLTLLRSGDELESLSITSYNYVREKYSFDQCITRWSKILNLITNKNI